MKKFVKSSLIFLGGFAAGVATAYLAATHLLDIEFIDEKSEATENKTDSHQKEKTDISEPVKEELTNENTPIDPFTESYKAVEENDHYVDYTKLLNQVKYNTDPESDDIYDNIIPDNVDIFGDPLATSILVDDSEFGKDLEYDEITIRYYEKNDLLTDDWDYPIENIEATIGNEAMEKLRKGDSDAVYVRNDRLKAYYEIVCHVEDYPGISG